MSIKPGVELTGIRPEMVIAHTVVIEEFARIGLPWTITSGTEGHHGKQSLHYAGCALDYRVRDLSIEQRSALAERVQERLRPLYDVILESGTGAHLHVEYQPKWQDLSQRAGAQIGETG